MNKAKSKIAIFGYGGHGKVVEDIAKISGYKKIYLYDDKVEGIKIKGNFNNLLNSKIDFQNIFIAIGDNNTRKKYASKIEKKFKLNTFIHSRSFISQNVIIGNGSIIMPGVTINTNVKIGKGCIINTGAIIDHETEIGDFVHIGPSVTIGGQAIVGDLSWIGIGANILNNVNIEDKVIIGGGSLVNKNAKSNKTYFGVPAKLKK
jgi:sugar O-acyltransferase (sialic acid O-acetyltransferase NeuD family)